MAENQGSCDLDLDGSFLEGLTPLIKRYTYHGKSQFFDILGAESAHFESSIDISEFLLFYASKETIENIFDPWNEDEDPSISKLCTSFDTTEQLLLITIPSFPHSAAADVVNTTILQTLIPMGLITALRGYPGATVEGADRGKQPNYGWGPKRRVPGQPRGPSITLQVAYSASDLKLTSDVRFWLNPDYGNANICLTLRIDRSRPEIRIEKWERQNNKAHRSQVIWVTKQGRQLKVTDHPLLIPFESLFRYQSTCPREKELEISQQQLEEIATTIWDVQWDQEGW
ncbi:hypothetical protein N7537_005739 [Penicillium hordei]|uniref:Uncharacterized protein n=1 Tax=Penicillium hordei TaxID=40994 RepID=A0AAD6H2F7_9EURO|nr:uncharacterized protein N7537_005739 [Penicillium hordei]KAJ5602783.1 hypothetical protein N7537_005739 [Penicillium hordei]